MKKSLINPLLLEQFMFGGMMGDSAGGQAVSGALSGAMGGASLGLPGMVIGGAIGGISSFLNAKKQNEASLEAKLAQEKNGFMNFISSSNLNQGNGSNIPMAMGGAMGAGADMMNPLLVEFNEGGSHEQNPLGGIPQGKNAQGKTRTVEEGETKFRFKKQGDYIFSNRLSPLSYDF